MQQANESSLPIDFLLKSFNALDPAVAGAPTQLLANLLDFRLAPITETQVNRSQTNPTLTYQYTEDKSTQSSYTNTAASLGIEGSYGVHSGSVKAEMEKETDTSSKTLRSSFTAHISCGSLLFSKYGSTADVARALSPQAISALNGIKSLADAEAFTKTYGTHVVLGVGLGGSLSVVVQVETTSFAEKERLAGTVKAAYTGIGSISAVAEASQETKTAAGTDSIKQELQAIGGTIDTLSKLKIADETSIQNWEGSCGPDSVLGLFKSIEFWRLATDPSAGGLLKHYLDLCLLKRGLENPVVFSKYGPITAGQYNTVTATVTDGYKIISGGAWLDANGPDFLTGSFPEFDSTRAISGWNAVSHDCMIESGPGDELVAYALGVYDPADLLSIICKSASGTNPQVGGDTATAPVAEGCLLTGGGAETSSTQTYARYLTGSFPSEEPDYNNWVARGHDYTNASNATLTAWAVGLAANLPELTISKKVQPEQGGMQSHGTSFAALGTNQKIAGGGVELEQGSGKAPETLQNLLHASFPSSQGEVFGWQEFNGDLNGLSDKAIATAYAFTLKATSTVPGVTFQPYNVQLFEKALAEA